MGPGVAGPICYTRQALLQRSRVYNKISDFDENFVTYSTPQSRLP
jgi:hypothetical protein